MSLFMSARKLPWSATTWMPWTRTAWTASANPAGRMSKSLRQTTDAVSFLIETLKTTPDVTILALGPMTNLAKVISCAPECLDESRQHWSPWAEATRVTETALRLPSIITGATRTPQPKCSVRFSELPQLAGKKLHMIGLDVTRKIVLTPNLVEYMKCVNPGSRNPHRGADTFLLRFSLETGKGHRMRNQRSARSRLSCGSVALQRF